jgi:flavin-dependent dehydrogenase
MLEDGARIGVIGGGPAGSFFSIFALDMAARAGLRLSVEIYERRDFSIPGPQGCNMCGGVISESLVQHLAVEGIDLPTSVIQRGIDSYVLHTDIGEVRIATPTREKRIGAVFRGVGPWRPEGPAYASFDGYLLGLAEARGARIIRRRAERITRQSGFPVVATADGRAESYDLVVVACGVNSGGPLVLEGLGLEGAKAHTTKTMIREYYAGRPVIRRTLGDAMHVFLLDIPRLEFAAVIPKGDFVSCCVLGDEVDRSLLDRVLASPVVAACMPESWRREQPSCRCGPRMNVGWSGRPYGERVMVIGDAGVTRLYKDGIGGAYRTAKAAASAAVFEGVSQEDLRVRFWPACRTIARDNAVGRLIFQVVHLIQRHRVALHALLRVVAREQADARRPARMSTVLWDTFTGSAPYREILVRALHPLLLLRLAGALIASVWAERSVSSRPASGNAVRAASS